MTSIYSKKYEKILAPMDGSEASKKALVEAICISKYTHSKIVGLYVVQSDTSEESFVNLLKPLSSIREKGYESKHLFEASQIMTDSLTVCQENGIEFSGVASKGEPGRKILSYSERHGIDMIVMGSTGKGYVKGALLGSVSTYVLHNSKFPVTIVR